MTTGETIIYLIDTVPSDGDAWLTEDERSRAGGFRFQEDRNRWIACRTAMRRILGSATGTDPADVPLVTGPFGKPLLAPPFDSLHFNLSHCADLAVLAVSREGPVGIDIEPLDRAADLADAVAGFCHPLEVAELPCGPCRNLRLLEIWTAKEALLKALGTGFSTPPESVRMRFADAGIVATSDDPAPGIDGFVVHRIDDSRLSGHMVMVCVAGREQAVITMAGFQTPGDHGAG